MTNKELIVLLLQQPEDAEVLFLNHDYEHEPIMRVSPTIRTQTYFKTLPHEFIEISSLEP